MLVFLLYVYVYIYIYIYNCSNVRPTPLQELFLSDSRKHASVISKLLCNFQSSKHSVTYERIVMRMST